MQWRCVALDIGYHNVSSKSSKFQYIGRCGRWIANSYYQSQIFDWETSDDLESQVINRNASTHFLQLVPEGSYSSRTPCSNALLISAITTGNKIAINMVCLIHTIFIHQAAVRGSVDKESKVSHGNIRNGILPSIPTYFRSTVLNVLSHIGDLKPLLWNVGIVVELTCRLTVVDYWGSWTRQSYEELWAAIHSFRQQCCYC